MEVTARKGWDERYYTKHREEIRERMVGHNHKYYEEHKEEQRKRKLAYYYANKDVRQAAARRYKAEHRKEMTEYTTKWLTEHSGKACYYQTERIDAIKVIDDISKSKLIAMQDGKCAYCGKEISNNKKTHLDHLLPVSRYRLIGKKCPHSWGNVVAACYVCNTKKHDKTPLEFIWGNI